MIKTKANLENAKRAELSQDLREYQKELVGVLPILESEPSWYGSIYFARKLKRNYSVDLKSTQASEDIEAGIVLRIYDGFTLFEEALDRQDIASVQEAAKALAARVRRQSKEAAERKLKPRVYEAATWKERLSRNLDPEIRVQVPKEVKAGTPVHFGIRFEKDPYEVGSEAILKNLKNLLEQASTLAPMQGLKPEDLSFALLRQMVAKEESLFIDRETNLSQTLYRLALTFMLMSGDQRTYTRVGGLGGLETVEFPVSEINKLLSDLKDLKTADRLKPGKYLVLCSPEITGVLAHEAFGHSQEGDTCARGRSKAWDLYQSGEVVGNKYATIYNNPAIYENGETTTAAWGSYFFDEEGWLAEEQVILDQGKLTAPMTNLTSSLRLNVPRTANGKRESWARGVYTRQTNTYFSAGDKTYEELLSKVDDGFLATHAAGGMEDPKGMGIQVGIAFLREVKNGKLTGRVLKGPAGGDIQMTGYTPDILNSILDKSKIEFTSSKKDMARFPLNDVGGCGKYHKELVFAGSGGPYLLLENVTLG